MKFRDLSVCHLWASFAAGFIASSHSGAAGSTAAGGRGAMHSIALVAAAVTLALPAETRAAVRAAGGSGAAVSLQPAALRRIVRAAQGAGQPVREGAAAVSVWEAWRASLPVDAAREAALLAELRAVLGWEEPQLPLPSPAKALAALHTCSNPACVELSGDSEARVQLKACAHCGAVAYCCR